MYVSVTYLHTHVCSVCFSICSCFHFVHYKFFPGFYTEPWVSAY